MGKALQIRVSAVTWNEALLKKLWPKLNEFAFNIPHKHPKQGVLEMVQCLGDGLQFMPWQAERKEKLGPNIIKAVETMRNLENALANWEPRKAHELSEQLEDILNSLEQDFI